MASRPYDRDLKLLPNVTKARIFTNDKLTKLRKATAKHALPSDILIGTSGSYARREASGESDLDFFVICRDAKHCAEAREAFQTIAPELTKIAGRPPSDAGAFGEVDDLNTMLSKIGGNEDINFKLTRRVLFLLEGEWLNQQGFFEEIRDKLLGCYVRDVITPHQLALFLLNDIIRYYRTICVDFDFKTIQEAAPKPWGTRNIKLVFSRKLLYFSGVLAVAETAQRSYSEKMKVLKELFSLPVIDRVLTVCGSQAFHALELYDSFLGEFAKEEVRRALDSTRESDRTEEPFRRLKDNGHHFSWRLMTLFNQTYDASHPIHRALFL